ncbi:MULTISPECIES: PadR family transcriptional regulator [unclassified Arthrobacter]|uniref:PadR family transcriptional regulator n=1 Tax=unclassified Arthrobacter TaxID=235627 RepID=UPI001D13A32B|nr:MULTISPECIES: PadR family transcriptional regulator [unclassified Arthrobacter]MCC3289841.1 PadR family transcriptional regulator [Arthrobacter sp. zg-Y1110]MCC3300656.1 PadR family transcriptional regulator [Arthrobacter sp. zg-Y895]UWX84744.1 PadR family transcriptional regulator [Arthrobacter sp. zg-Y1110]
MSTREMREPTFLILTALARGRHHGYSLLTETKKLSGGRVSLKPGSLYTTLDRLQEEGLVQDAGEEVVAGRLRRYYALTDNGADALKREADRMEAAADAARQSLRIRTKGALA